MSDAKSLQFVDANVLIYAHDFSAGAKRDRARDLLRDLLENRNGCVSTQVLQEFYVNVTRKIANPVALDVAAEIISDHAVWTVHQAGIEDILDAIQLQQQHQLSFWDAMIITSAMALGCDVVWSEDFSHGQRFGSLSVLSPFV
jgi:predicted nucleic acid-binding protein